MRAPNIWNWVPDEVRYYVARTGQDIGITQRNYKRYLGVLLDTHWILDELELGVYDKVYDMVTGKHWFERKIIKTKIGAIIDLQWIKERTAEDEMTGEITAPTEEELLEAKAPTEERVSPEEAPTKEQIADKGFEQQSK